MASVYDRTDIYDLFDSPKKDAQTLSHWQAVFDGRPIRSALDVSIGTGSLTLPLGQLGVSLYGSDLSDSMLALPQKGGRAWHRHRPAAERFPRPDVSF